MDIHACKNFIKMGDCRYMYHLGIHGYIFENGDCNLLWKILSTIWSRKGGGSHLNGQKWHFDKWLKGWVTTPTSHLLNLPMKCVLFLLFCSIAAVIFLTCNLYIVWNTNVHQWNIAMCDYQEKVWLVDTRTDRRTDRRRTKWSLCAAMLRRRYKNLDYLV